MNHSPISSNPDDLESLDLDQLRRLVEEQPTRTELRLALVARALGQGDSATVLSQHRYLAELSPSKDCREAVLRLQEEIHLNPQPGPAAIGQMQPWLAAIKPEIYLRMGSWYLRSARPAEALPYLKKSQELRPATWETHLALGQCYFALDQHREAIGELQEVVRLGQDQGAEATATAYLYLGRIFRALGRPTRSTSTWYLYAATLWFKSQRPDRAQAVYQELLEIDPQNAEARAALQTESVEEGPVRNLMQRGDFVSALRETERILREQPGHLATLIQRGECLKALERQTEWLENQQLIQQIRSGL